MRFFLFFFIALLPIHKSFGAVTPEFSSVLHLIDFRIYYPVLRLKSGATIRQKNYVGMDVNYHYFFDDRYGPVFSVGGWMAPLRVNSRKTNIGMVTLLTGGAYRFFPRSYFDPTLYALGGGGWEGAENDMGTRFFTMAGPKLAVNLYNQRDLYQDTRLALTLSGSSMYVFQPLSIMKPLYFDLGLSLKGSF